MYARKIGKDWKAMIKKNNTLVKICNIACVLAIMAMFAVMCLPQWNYTAIDVTKVPYVDERTGKTLRKEIEVERDANASIMGVTWLTYEHEDLTDGMLDEAFEQFKAAGGKRKYFEEGKVLNRIVLMPFVVTLLGICSLIFGLWKMNKTWPSLFATIASAYAVLALLTEPMYSEGQNYMITLIVSCAALAVSLVLFVQWAISVIKWFAAKK
jgi:hypothetical protein